MKVTMTKRGIILEPEDDFEKTCLAHLAKRSGITITWLNEWDQTGNMIIEGKPDDWGT